MFTIPFLAFLSVSSYDYILSHLSAVIQFSSLFHMKSGKSLEPGGNCLYQMQTAAFRKSLPAAILGAESTPIYANLYYIQ